MQSSNTSFVFILVLQLFVAITNAQENVGIGTLTPAYRLDVQSNPASTIGININSKVNHVGNADIRAIEGTSVTNPGYGIGGRFIGGYKGVEAVLQGGNYTGGLLYGVYSIAGGTAGSRVGVYGQAVGGTTNVGVWGVVQGGANHYAIYGTNNNAAGYAGYFDGRGLFINDLRGNDNLYIDDNVGIGTIVPNTKLQILGGADAGLLTNGYAQFGSSNTWNLVLDDNEILARNNGAGNDLLFQQDAGNILMCGLEQGKVGIGVQLASNLPAGYMLAVDGKIIGEELRIQNSDAWPDYVFAEEYPLMPLEAVKASIEKNKHLPNIPPAAEVERDGVLVGDMQRRMMEKIEELTLYVITLHEENKKQQAEIERLQDAITTMSQK